MKDSSFLVNAVDADIIEILDCLVTGDVDDNFAELVKISCLDPKNDFRYSNLRCVDFSNSNLTGFDFTGADLSGSYGISVIWNESTIFDQTDVHNSLFSLQLNHEIFFTRDAPLRRQFELIANASWSEQIIWAGRNFLEGKQSKESALLLAEALLFRTKDEFVKAELITYIGSRYKSSEDICNFILAMMSRESNSSIILKSAIRLAVKSKLEKIEPLRKCVFALIYSEYSSLYEPVVNFIVSSCPNQNELTSLLQSAKKNEYIGRLYVGAVSKLLGDEYNLITRDPITNQTFSLNQIIPSNIVALIARRWARVESDRSGDYAVTLALRRQSQQEIYEKEISQFQVMIISMWARLLKFGIALTPENTNQKV